MRTAAKVVVPLLVLLAILAVARGAMMVQPPATAEELEQLTGTDWFAVSILGQPNGYARIESDVIDGENGPQLRVTEELKVLVNIRGQHLEASKSQVTIHDQQLRPISIEMVRNELGRASELSAHVEGSEMVVRTGSGSTEDGGAPANAGRLEIPEDFASDQIIALRLNRGELQPGDTLSYSVYDPEVDVIDRHNVTIAERKTVDGTEVTVVEAASEKLGVEVVSWIDDAGRLVRQSVPGVMQLTLERVSEEEALASLAPFEIKNTIEVEEHLPLVRSLKQVRLRVQRDVGPAAELLAQTPRQQITEDGSDAMVTTSREHPPDESLPLPITGDRMEPYLAATTQVQSDAPRIIEKAREIVGDETNSWAAAQKLCSWVHRRMHSVSSDPRPVTALEVLDSMRGDCTEHAILMAALGRAVGLPTKLATGLAYVGGEFGYHAWTEVYVGRWVEMDPSWGEMTVDAGHILVYSSSLDQASFAQASLATGRTIGAITMQVEGYTTADGREVEVGEQQ